MVKESFFHILVSARQNLLLYLLIASKKIFSHFHTSVPRKSVQNVTISFSFQHSSTLTQKFRKKLKPHYLSKVHFPNLEPQTA